MNRKLLKLDDSEYVYLVDGNLLIKGSSNVIKNSIESFNIPKHEVELALKVMEDLNHDVSDFGINGGFLFSQHFKDADLGFKKLREA